MPTGSSLSIAVGMATVLLCRWLCLNVVHLDWRSASSVMMETVAAEFIDVAGMPVVVWSNPKIMLRKPIALSFHPCAWCAVRIA